MLGTKKRTYGSKKSECGPINHKDILRNAPDTSTLFEALSSTNIKKYRKDNSYLFPTNGHSLGFGRKRILITKKAAACPKQKTKEFNTDTSSDDSLHVKHHSNDLFDQLRLSLKDSNDPFEQLLAGDRSKELPAEINPKLNITTDSAASSPEEPLVQQRDPSFKPSKVKKKRKSSKKKKLKPVLPFSVKNDTDSIIHHKFQIENEANKKKVSPELKKLLNLPSCSKPNVFDTFANNSSFDTIPGTPKECDNSQIKCMGDLYSYSPIINRIEHKKFCDNLGTPDKNIPPLSSTPYRKSRLPTYIQEHDLSAISSFENSSQGNSHYYSINYLKKVEKEAKSLSYSKIKDNFLKNNLKDNDQSIDFKMSSEPILNVTNIFTDPVVNVTNIFTDPVVNVTNIFTDPAVNVTNIFTDPVVNVTDMFAQPVGPRKSQRVNYIEHSILCESEDESVNVTDTCAQPAPIKFNRIKDNDSSMLTESDDESDFRGFHLDTKETMFYRFSSNNNSGKGSPVLFDSTLSDYGCDENQIMLGRMENNKLTQSMLSNDDKVFENTSLACKLTSLNESQHLSNLTDDSDATNSSFDSEQHNPTGKHSTDSMEYNLFNDSKLAKVPIVVLTKLNDQYTDNLSKSFELESNYNDTGEIELDINNFNSLYSGCGNVDTVIDASEISHLSSDKFQIEKYDCNISHSSSENVDISPNISKILYASIKTLEEDNNDSQINCINDKDIEKECADSKVLNPASKKAFKSIKNSPKYDTSINNKVSDVSKSSLDKLKENLEPNEQSAKFVRRIVDSPIVLRNKKTVYRGQAYKNKKTTRKATKSTSLDEKTSNKNKIPSAEITQPEILEMTLEELAKTQEAFKELEVNETIMENKNEEGISILDASDYSAINKGGNQFVTAHNTVSDQYSLDISAFSCLNKTRDSPNNSVDYDRTVSEIDYSRDTLFNPRETLSNKRQTFLNTRETTSNRRGTFYNKRETSSNTRETFSNKLQTSFNKRDTFYNRRETFYNRRETFYNNDEFSAKPSIVLEPGKRWERSLRILRNLNRSNMTLNDTIDSCNATIQENPHPKGRKYRESVAHLINLQSKDGRRNSVADFSRTFHDTFSTTCVNTTTILEEPTLLPDEIVQDISQLSNSSAEELLSDACNDTAINLSRLAISKVARSSLLDKEVPAWSALNARDVVLRRCNQTHPLPFDECYPDKKLQKCCKIGEGVYGEVFLYKNEDDPTNPIVMKVIPIEGTQLVNGDHQKKFEEIISEIVIAMELSDLRNNEENNTLGFNKVNRVRCVKGRYPDRLVELWELYDELKGSENDCPTLFDAGQLFIILELANGGKDLEAFKFTTAEQSYYLFFQIAFALAVAEEAFQFEHRDLHWGNVLISFAENASVTYKLRGEPYSIPTAGVLGNIIDFTLSRVSVPAAPTIYNDLAKDPDLFVAEGDYQFEIYRLMQQKNGNLWDHFEPYSNILWLHYTLDKMITALRYERTDTCVHGIFISKLQYLKEKILQYDSCVDFVTNEECFTIADI